MDTLHPAPTPADDAATGTDSVVITRVTEHLWHALEDDQVVGRGDVTRRSDGRLFISVDAWHETVFHRLVNAMAAELPRPLFTVVDEADTDQTAAWLLADFSIARRERGYVIPTGETTVRLPRDVTIIPAGELDATQLRALDRTIRAEITATVGWHTMPAEVLPRPDGILPEDVAKYTVAAREIGQSSERGAGHGTEYVALLRIAPIPRQPRIGLLAVRTDQRRQGIGRALLAQALATLHKRGVPTAWAEITEANTEARALVESFGARPAGGILELVRR